MASSSMGLRASSRSLSTRSTARLYSVLNLASSIFCDFVFTKVCACSF